MKPVVVKSNVFQKGMFHYFKILFTFAYVEKSQSLLGMPIGLSNSCLKLILIPEHFQRTDIILVLHLALRFSRSYYFNSLKCISVLDLCLLLYSFLFQ